MKKQLLGLITILTVLGACQKNEVSVELSEAVTIHATIEDNDATKTVMDENNNILWSENDQIIAFMKSSYAHKYQVKSSFVGKSYADFSRISSGSGDDLSAGNAWDHNVVYYPFSENIECLKSGSNYALEVNLPSEQVYVPNSFANGSMAMVAVSENNNITFNNVLGGIKLQLKGTQTVKSIKIEGKNNEKLSGAAIVTAYTDETKPAITMTSDASTSVTLNCGKGVQLNESTTTEFIIVLPPVLFSNGFTVNVTDIDEKIYTVRSTVANTVLRSTILVMPAVTLTESGDGFPDNDENEDELVIPVSNITLNSSSLTIYEGDSALLIATILPKDATDKTIVWSSDNPEVAIVDQTGNVTALSTGTAIISAVASGKLRTCSVTVEKSSLVDYIDEYGINHGKGTAIGMAVWAPVNCGYKKATSNDKGYPYGKLYQWGRKYGQGYDDSDASTPTLEEGGDISIISGSHKSKANVFYTGAAVWFYRENIYLWNSETEENPVKTEYDPCPEGWRTPTGKEMAELISNKSEATNNTEGHNGYWCSGPKSYTKEVPQIFLHSAGKRQYDGEIYYRNDGGYYWTSRVNRGADQLAYYVSFSMYSSVTRYYVEYPSCGYSVRCVQE